MTESRFFLKNALLYISVLFLVLSLPLSLMAAPSQISLSAFSSSATVVDFNSIANEELITGQYASSGVTFSGALYGMTNSGDLALFPNNGGGVIASNWLYSKGAYQGLSFAATFNSIKTKVGFYVETNPTDNTTIEVLLNGNSHGSVQFATSNTGNTFIGVEDPNGFDSMTVTVQDNNNGFIAIDDLHFEGGTTASATTAVPTFSEWGMITFTVLAGLSSIYFIRRKRRTQS